MIKFFFLFAIIEYVIILLITKFIDTANYDCISIKYTSFRFSTSDYSPTGLNILIKIFFPTIYIIILAGFLYNMELNSFVNNIYIVTIFYYILKWMVMLVLNRIQLINWKNELFCFLLAISLSYFIYIVFISQTTKIFLSLEEIREGIWVAIITFFLSLLINTIYNNCNLNIEEENKNIRAYIQKNIIN